MKILITGHACSPYRGSEPSFTWNWSWHLAKEHEVWVITHPHERADTERYLQANPNPRLHFNWINLPQAIDPWDPANGEHGLRLHYILWQRLLYRTAVSLHRQVRFDFAQHVSWGSLSHPPLVSKLPLRFVWGPLGGGHVSPSSFRSYFGKTWPKEAARNTWVRCLSRLRPVQRAAAASTLVLATNHDTRERLQRAGARDARLFLDSGLSEGFLAREPLSRPSHDRLRLLWVGKLIRRKALPLLLEALVHVKDLPVDVWVLGDGPMRDEWEQLSADLDLRRVVKFFGQVDWTRMPDFYREADAFVFTSLRDSFGTQVLEAMGQSLPLIVLDHQGAGTFVSADAGIKVPVTTPAETVAGIAAAIRSLAASHGLRQRMGTAAWQFAREQTWPRRVDIVSRWYRQILDQSESSQPENSLERSPAAV